MNLDYNPILDTDSYKLLGHFGMLPDDVTKVFSYAESRGGRYADTVFFGLQPYIQRLNENPVTLAHWNEARELAMQHGGYFNDEGWLRIINHHGGYLPLEIRAVPEGTLVPTKNVLCTVENTDPLLPWLPGYVETALLRQLWYGTTVATRIFNMKRGIAAQFDKTADDGRNNPAMAFALLDFSSRGCAGLDANMIGGAAYLANFLGSDSVPAVRYVNNYYSPLGGMSGFSVPATEHSIMCSWGEEREQESFRTMIERFGGPGKIVSIVADTWDVFRAAEYAARMADLVHDSGTTLVFRPDSGTPQEVMPRVLGMLFDGFGFRTNTKGYDVLNGVKLLWGDGIDEGSYLEPFEIAKTMGISAESIMVGSGGGLMQADINRDTCKFAFKASAVKRGVNGWEGIAKNPITDPGKQSKKGRIKLIHDRDTGFRTVEAVDPRQDVMRPVYNTGLVMNVDNIETIRARIDSHL